MSKEQIETINNDLDIDTNIDNTDNDTNINDMIENDTTQQLTNILCENIRKTFLD